MASPAIGEAGRQPQGARGGIAIGKSGLGGRTYLGLTHADPRSRAWINSGPRSHRRSRPQGLACGSIGDRAAHIARLWSDGTLAALMDAGLIPICEPVELGRRSVAFALAADPVLMAPAEWCGSAWRAATVSILRLLEELSTRQLTLESVRPEFMVFDQGCRPLYLRLGSIIPNDPNATLRACGQLADFFFLPLFLCATGRSAALRELLARGDSLAPGRAFPELADAARAACNRCNDGCPGGYAQLECEAAALEMPVAQTFWSGYYPSHLSTERSETWPYKVHSVDRILESMAPATMLDLAANTGLYSRIAASKGIRVIALDSDETCVERLFQLASQGNTAIVPAVGDICSPVALPMPLDRRRLSAQRRFRSELVLALAISHHLVFSPPWLGFAEIAGLFSSYCGRYLLTEFVGLEPEALNPYRADDRTGSESWYTLEGFTAGLRRCFKEVVLVPGPKGRQLVLAEK